MVITTGTKDENKRQKGDNPKIIEWKKIKRMILFHKVAFDVIKTKIPEKLIANRWDYGKRIIGLKINEIILLQV
ncbi:MAG: hypothetical protein GC181_14030 [Bacteroidetes bacterium]|nr:hypothetical protein [Bacteroidota bacterium]